MRTSFRTPQELQIDLGDRVRALRIDRRKTQAEVAVKADVGLRSVIALEKGSGSTVETFVRVLKALGAEDLINALVPEPEISPVAMLERSKPVLRVRHSRKRRP